MTALFCISILTEDVSHETIDDELTEDVSHETIDDELTEDVSHETIEKVVVIRHSLWYTELNQIGRFYHD